jgi:hypothetical protein
MDAVWIEEPCVCGAAAGEECLPDCVSWTWPFERDEVA